MAETVRTISKEDILLAMGIRFWSSLVITLEIEDIEQCSTVLQNLGLILKSKDRYRSFFGALYEGIGVEQKVTNNKVLPNEKDPQNIVDSCAIITNDSSQQGLIVNDIESDEAINAESKGK